MPALSLPLMRPHGNPAVLATFVTLIGGAVTVGCATSQPVRPLGRGRTAMNTSVGGPLVRALGVDMPTPILSVGAAHGVRDNLEATARVDVTAAAYGVLHVEPGVAYHPYVNDGPGLVPTLTVAGSLHLLTDFQAVRAAPMIATVAAWRVGGRHLVYAGADVGLAFGSPTRLVAGPLVGDELRLGAFGVGIETKWLAPYHDVEPAAPDWLSPGHHGYLFVLLGLHYYFDEAH